MKENIEEELDKIMNNNILSENVEINNKTTKNSQIKPLQESENYTIIVNSETLENKIISDTEPNSKIVNKNREVYQINVIPETKQANKILYEDEKMLQTEAYPEMEGIVNKKTSKITTILDTKQTQKIDNKRKEIIQTEFISETDQITIIFDKSKEALQNKTISETRKSSKLVNEDTLKTKTIPFIDQTSEIVNNENKTKTISDIEQTSDIVNNENKTKTISDIEQTSEIVNNENLKTKTISDIEQTSEIVNNENLKSKTISDIEQTSRNKIENFEINSNNIKNIQNIINTFKVNNPIKENDDNIDEKEVNKIKVYASNDLKNRIDSVEISNNTDIIINNKFNNRSINNSDNSTNKDLININEKDKIDIKKLAYLKNNNDNINSTVNKNMNYNNNISNNNSNVSINNLESNNYNKNNENKKIYNYNNSGNKIINDNKKNINNSKNNIINNETDIDDLYNELFPADEHLEDRKEKALKIIYNELLNITDPTILLKKVINILEKKKKDPNNINNTYLTEDIDSKNNKRKETHILESNSIKRVKQTPTNNSINSSYSIKNLDFSNDNYSIESAQKNKNLIPLAKIKKEFDEPENITKENQSDMLQHLFDHSSSYIPTRSDINRDSFGNASSSSTNIYDEEEEPMDLEKINSIRLAGISERNRKRLVKIMRGKGKHIPKQRLIKIKSRRDSFPKEIYTRSNEINSGYREKENYNKYNYELYDSESDSTENENNESELDDDNYKYKAKIYPETRLYDSSRKRKRQFDFDNNIDEKVQENYSRNFAKKRKEVAHENALYEKSGNEIYYENHSREDEINHYKINKRKKAKSPKKIYPLFRKIKVINANSSEKDNKEGKYQFLHQKLFIEESSSSFDSNKRKDEDFKKSINTAFDTTTNTTDIALHLTLYNIQKYRKKRPVDNHIDNILINFEKNIKKEFVLMNYEMKRREQLLKILEKTKKIKQSLLQKESKK